MSEESMTLTVLCTGLAEAVTKDEVPEVGGFDLSAGMFGPNVSDWLRGVRNELLRRRPMTRDEAIKALDTSDWISWVGKTPSAQEAKLPVCLDGTFSIAELEAIVFLMRAAQSA